LSQLSDWVEHEYATQFDPFNVQPGVDVHAAPVRPAHDDVVDQLCPPTPSGVPKSAKTIDVMIVPLGHVTTVLLCSEFVPEACVVCPVTHTPSPVGLPAVKPLS
jgi:hypothetical protein